MKLSNIQIENFRNIVKANVNFSSINIFTGKNASGKSNFLLAISSSIKTGTDFSDIFYENIVTFGRGKSKTIIKATIEDLNTKYIYGGKNSSLITIDPKSFIFENTFNKRSFSPSHHSLFFTGSYSSLDKNTANISNDIGKKLELIEREGIKKDINNELVYGRSFVNEKVENSGDKQIIEKVEITDFQDSDKFISIFEGYENELSSWVKPMVFSSSSISNYVLERIENNEIYEQVVNFLKTEKNKKDGSFSRTPFSKAKFIQLLADVQKNEKQMELFQKDLKFFTDGILTNLSIKIEGDFGNKGEIAVESPNAPKDIFCVSAGTAVMVYFILLKNWSELNYSDKSFIQPKIMIFDEIDSIIHPSLMLKFTEILRSISKNIQLFLSTHSASFIDCFDKNQVFWLKDTVSISEATKTKAVSSVYSYQEIIDRISVDKDYFLKRNNSELFIDGLIDTLFPLI